MTTEVGEKTDTFTFRDDHRVQFLITISSAQEFADGRQSNICNHLMSRDFIESVKKEDLVEHDAVKDPLPNMNLPPGTKIVKIEHFIFDPFEKKSKNMGVINVERKQEFIPLKSRDDIDLVKEFARKYLLGEERENLSN